MALAAILHPKQGSRNRTLTHQRLQIRLRLKTLKGLTPPEFIYKQWTKEAERFRFNPLHQLPGLNI
jgi:hypothetical protein